MPVIRTPDQRLRVFISSTINELTAERKSAKAVIERLKLTPVFFESGARPHPPRELYRSYLDQSDVFIGIYWQSYGWIAPGMEISGLEDEWRLSGDKPKLIYIKNSAERDPKLGVLLEAIQNSDALCYQKFELAEELAELLSNDLAILLSERFQNAVAEKELTDRIPRTNLPTLRSELIGRSVEIKQLTEKLDTPGLGLITLTGPGGTGKTRLALELGKKMLNKFKDGIYFVSFGSVTNSARVPGVIAQTIGLNNTGVKDEGKWLLEYLFDKSLFLLLDNLEQIPEAGIFVSQILNKCPEIKVVVTSRTPLYIRSEHIFPVKPLEVKPYIPHSNEHSDAVQLFIQLSKESNPSITWNEENLAAVYSICQKVDGLPLAIELTAARCRHLTPFQLDKKLNTLLNSTLTGPRDFPERQKTLRNTIQWSYDLLANADQRLFHRLAIFQNGWSYEAVEEVCWLDFKETESLDDSLERLTDYGLVVKIPSDYNSYRLLQIIKEYAYEKLVQSGEDQAIKDFHCRYFHKLALANSQKTWTNIADPSHLRFREDYENIIAALHHALEIKDPLMILSLINYMNALYMTTGEIGYLFELLEKANIKSDPEGIEKMRNKIPLNLVAFTYLSVGFTRSTTGNFQEGLRDLQAARQFAHESNIPQIEAFALLFMGLTNVTLRFFEQAKEQLMESIQLNKKWGQLPGQLTAEIILHIIYLEENNIEKAIALLDNAIAMAQKGFMLLVESFALYERGYVHYYLKEYDLARQRFQQSADINKKYNLNLNGSFPLIGLALVDTVENNYESAILNFRKSLDCIRISGNSIEFECYKYAVCYYLAKAGQPGKAIRLYSFIRNQKNKSNFRPWITNYCFLGFAHQLLSEYYDESFIKESIENAPDLSPEEIYTMV